MIASAHLACGAASGIFVQKYLPPRFYWISRCLAAFVAGLASHVILDAWPHWEYMQYGSRLWAILLVETFVVLFCLLNRHRSRIMNIVIFCGMVGGAVPDLALLVWEKLFLWEPLLYFYFAMHIFHGSLPFFKIGLVLQIFLSVLAVIYVKSKSA